MPEFSDIDSDGDGSISADEFAAHQAGHRRMMPQPPANWLRFQPQRERTGSNFIRAALHFRSWTTSTPDVDSPMNDLRQVGNTVIHVNIEPIQQVYAIIVQQRFDVILPYVCPCRGSFPEIQVSLACRVGGPGVSLHAPKPTQESPANKQTNTSQSLIAC